MPTQASKDRRAARHAAEKAAKKLRRENATPLTEQETAIIKAQERVRNVPRGGWLNGKLYVNSQGPRANRPGENILHAEAEQENHERSVAAKHTVEYHVDEVLLATLPEHVGETLKVYEPSTNAQADPGQIPG